jgi:hypothetical protein
MTGSKRGSRRYQAPFPERTGWGLAHFSGRFGPKNVPVPCQGDSPIFADFAAKIGTVPVNGYVAQVKPPERVLVQRIDLSFMVLPWAGRG